MPQLTLPPTAVAFLPPFGFSCLDAIAGYMINVIGMSAFQFMAFRNGLATLALLPYLWCAGVADAPLGPPGYRRLLWTRGALVAMEITAVYTSMRYLTLSEVWMIISFTPCLSALLCWYWLDEAFSRIQGRCCLVSLLGVHLIVQPQPSAALLPHDSLPVNDHPLNGPLSKLVGVLIATSGQFLVAVEVVVLREMEDQVGHPQVLAVLAIAPTTIAALVMIVTDTPLVWPSMILQWIGLCAAIPLGWLSQATLTYIAGHLSGATLSMTTYTGVSTPLGFHFLGDHDELINKLVHATALQWGLYGTLPSVITFAGMITIVGTGMYSTMYGQVDKGDRRTAPDMDQAREVQSDDEAPLLAPSSSTPSLAFAAEV